MKNTISNYKLRLEAGSGDAPEHVFAYDLPAVFLFLGERCMSKKNKMIGREFGRLTVMERGENTKDGKARWKCRCKCENIVVVRAGDLQSGDTQSCGCLHREKVTKHSMARTPEYEAWRHMIKRCNNPKDSAYKNYGGRGITVCDKWLKLAGFCEDMGKKPEGLTLERRDNDLGYYKENCYYATCTEQVRNRRVQKRSKTGVTGVNWDKASGKYRATIGIENKNLYLGQFASLEKAVEVRKQAEQKYWRK